MQIATELPRKRFLRRLTTHDQCVLHSSRTIAQLRSRPPISHDRAALRDPGKARCRVLRPSRLSRFFLTDPIPERPAFFTRLRWGNLLGAASAAAFVGYALLVTTAFLFVRYQRELVTVQWLDLALPSRWPRYSEARGNQHVATALARAQAGQLRDALVFVRAGLARAPANRDGRLLLAELLTAARRPEAAQTTLIEGLRFHSSDPQFLVPLFDFLLQRQEDERLVRLARELLGHHPAPEPARLIALAAATASSLRGNYDRAEDFLRVVPGVADSRAGRLLAARIDAERGYRELALLELRALAAEFPTDVATHAELVTRLRQTGRRDEARRASVSFQLAHPTLARPHIELLEAYREDGDLARVAREVETLLREFSADAPALLALADFAANAGDVALARRLADHARAHRLPWEPHAFLVVEANVVARDYRAALAAIQSLTAENVDGDDRYQGLLDSLQALSCLGLGDLDTARVRLARCLNRTPLRAENLIALANRFAALGADELARQVLVRAIDADPLNQAALSRLVEFELNLNRTDDLPAHLRRLAMMRRPSPDLLRVAQHKLGSDLFLYSDERVPALDAVRLALENARPPSRP